MFSSWNIGKIFGISLFIHWTFWVLPLWVILTFNGAAEKIALWMHLLQIAVLFGCVVLHELGHALAARHFGIETRRITLSPLGGMAQMERMSQKPWEEFCIAVAGPLVNVVLAAIFGALLVAGFVVNPTLLGSAPGQFVSILLMMNVVMVIFNSLPAFPMDGGRVLRAILASTMGLLRGTRVAVNVGTVVALALAAAGVLLLGNPWLVMIALFVIWAGHQELRVLEWEERDRMHFAAQRPIPVVSMAPSYVTVFFWDPQRGEWIRR